MSPRRYNALHISEACRRHSRARCRICGRVWTSNPGRKGRYCPRHSHKLSFEARLGHICAKIQDEWWEQCRQNPVLHPMAPLPPPGCVHGSAGWWWEMVTGMHLQCTRGLINLWEAVRDRIKSLPEVSHVEEVQYDTYPYYGWGHCAFRVTLVTGKQYAFDPTGVQFGPLWSLLSPWARYEDSRVYRNLRFAALGSQQQEHRLEMALARSTT